VPLEDRKDPREELLHVEQRVELGRDLGEDRKLAGRADLDLGRRDRAAGLDHRDELVHDGRVVPGTREGAQLGDRRLGMERPPVWTVGEHRLVTDRDRQDPRRQ
jgi:hypothetical protein